MQALAAVSAHHVEHLGTRALETAQLLIVATHVPPFPEAAAWPGGLSDARHQPHAVSVHMGETLLRLADAHPTREILVLTGHTHGAGDYAPRPNLRVLTGASDYGRPRPQGVLQLSSMGATLRPIEAPAP
jgi:Icc protein